MKFPTWLADTDRIVAMSREHRQACVFAICSPTFQDDNGVPVIIDCRELTELPGWSGCCGPDCPQCP